MGDSTPTWVFPQHPKRQRSDNSPPRAAEYPSEYVKSGGESSSRSIEGRPQHEGMMDLNIRSRKRKYSSTEIIAGRFILQFTFRLAISPLVP